MAFLFGAACIIAMIFMVVFMFIGIWLFIVALKAFRQLKYKNYILEKIYQKLDHNYDNINSTLTEDFDEFFDLEKADNSVDFSNVKNHDKI